MTRGLLAGLRACASAVFMNLMLIYIFGMAIHSFLKGDHEINAQLKVLANLHCESLTSCMWLLLVDGTFCLDGAGLILTELVTGTTYYQVLSGLILLVFIFISSMVICNMLIGVLCEVVSQVTVSQRDNNAIHRLKSSLLSHLEAFDDGDGMLSKEEIEQVMHEPESKRLMEEMKVDRVFMLAMLNLFYRNGKDGFPICGILELLLECRSDNPATVATTAHTLSYLTFKLEQLHTDEVSLATDGTYGSRKAKKKMQTTN
jgi:hypothetical protein